MDLVDAIAKIVGAVVVPILLVVLNRRTTKALERQKGELARQMQLERAQFEERLQATSVWHAKRVDALVELHGAFREFLDFMRRRFYFGTHPGDVTPLHEFRQRLERIALFLDDVTKDRVERYSGELLAFWNWAMTLPGDVESKGQLQQRLDYEIPRYLEYIRQDIQLYLGGRAERVAAPLQALPPKVQGVFPKTKATDTCSGWEPREEAQPNMPLQPTRAAGPNGEREPTGGGPRG